MKTAPEFVHGVKEHIFSIPVHPEFVGTVRADLRQVQQVTLEATHKTEELEYHFLIDEPRMRGGLGRGATPLGHFLAGAGACLLMQYVSVAIAEELPVDAMKMTVRGRILGKLPRAFQDVIFELYLEGALSPAQVQALAEKATSYCFVENTLERAIPVTTEVYLNGNKALTLSRGPARAPAG